MEIKLRILKKRLLETDKFTEEKFNQFVAEGLHLPFIKSMNDYLEEYLDRQKPNIQNISTGEQKFRERLGKSKI